MAASWIPSTFISQVAGLLEKAQFTTLTHEFMVVVVFFVSFITWRHFSRSKPGFSRGGQGKFSGREGDTKATRMRFDVSRNAEPLLSRQRANEILPQVRAAEQQMLKHLEQREFTRALNMYRMLERDKRDRHFSAELYSAFIQSAVRVGKVDVVDRMLRAMKRSGMTPSLQFWQTTLKMLSSRRHFSTCLATHSVFGSLMPADKIIYSCLINAALEVGEPDRAAAMLERYGEADIDIRDHVLFFRTYVALKDVDSAETMLRKLGENITTLMLNLLLLACINARQPQRAFDFLLDAHRIEEGVAEKIVDVVSYNTVIKGFAQVGQPAECFECLHQMLSQKLEPDDITFGTLLDACILDNDMGAAHQIVNRLMGIAHRPMDTVMCTLFIKGLVRANCLPKALELYDEMKRREDARPDIVTYSVLTKALVDQHDLDRALQLVEDMNAAGQSPDDIIVTHLLEGCRHAGNHVLGKRLFVDMVASGVKPSEFTLITMLKLHGRCGAHKEAFNLVAGWRGQHGFAPSVIHYTCLMSGCLRTKNYDQAWAAYELMRTNGVAPDGTAIATLLPGMVAAQQWGRVLALAQHALMAPTPVAVPPETLNNALSQMLAVGGNTAQGEQLRAMMQSAGIAVTARISRHLPDPISQ
mmetsp:Transcript_55740/g.107560  ORF Transcript_55740/g.107560 Transcript_55740/m.107560 type:complete len:642 (+) Transcript_55740:144-2069(+)